MVLKSFPEGLWKNYGFEYHSNIKSRRYCIFLKENMLIFVKLNLKLQSTHLCLRLVLEGLILKADFAREH